MAVSPLQSPLHKMLKAGITIGVECPERYLIGARSHNRIAREALKATAEFHWKKNIPKHFRRDARTRYGYKPRKPGYMMWKQKKYGTGGLDLVMSGKSRERMRREHSIAMSGSAEGGKKGLLATLRLRFDFDKEKKSTEDQALRAKGIRPDTPQQAARRMARLGSVTIMDMRRELGAATREEKIELAKHFRAGYLQRWRGLSKARRKLTGGMIATALGVG